MIINSFDIVNFVLDNKSALKVEDKFNTATLILCADEAIRAIGWGSKMDIGTAPTPFKINHPIFKNHAFKMIDLQPKRRYGTLLEGLIAMATN